MKEKLSLSVLNRSAAEIAAAAFYETFPGVELLGGKRTSLGFSFDFCCSSPIPSDVEILIAERMRGIIREKRPIRVLEMVPVSARELLLKKGHTARANAIQESSLVEIVQIGSFHNLSPGPHLSCSSQLTAFKIWPMQNLGAGVFRLSGSAYPTKEELNLFLKKWRDYPAKSHETVGVQRFLWRLMDGKVVWLPAGLKQVKWVIERVKEHLFAEALEIHCHTGGHRTAFHASLARELSEDRNSDLFMIDNSSEFSRGSKSKFQAARGIAEIFVTPSPCWDPEIGLFSGVGGTQIQVSFFSSSGGWREKMISSLQLSGKTLNILGFQYQLRLGGRKRSVKTVREVAQILQSLGMEVEEYYSEEFNTLQLDLVVEDQVGRQWPAFSIQLERSAVVVTASVERLVAFLIEMESCANER